MGLCCLPLLCPTFHEEDEVQSRHAPMICNSSTEMHLGEREGYYVCRPITRLILRLSRRRGENSLGMQTLRSCRPECTLQDKELQRGGTFPSRCPRAKVTMLHRLPWAVIFFWILPFLPPSPRRLQKRGTGYQITVCYCQLPIAT